MNYWLFQANAEYFDLLRALRSSPTITWIVTRYRREMQEGDKVIIWRSGRTAGIYGVGHIESFLTGSYNRQNSAYWLDKTDTSYIGKPHAVVRVDDQFTDAPLLKSVLRFTPPLAKLSVMKAPIGTNFKVTAEQWEALSSLLERRKGACSSS
jgi:predicted RNA-binding protein with PUA-like domain